MTLGVKNEEANGTAALICFRDGCVYVKKILCVVFFG